VVTSIFQALEAAARPRMERGALEWGSRYLTFAELLAAIGHCADALVELGVEPGDRVVVQIEKSLENVVLYFAVLRQGGVYVPLNTGYTDAELEYFVGDAEPALVVVEEGRRSGVEAIVGARARVVTIDALSAHVATRSTGPVTSSGSDLAAIVYTSGTTGRSKGAMLSHDNLLSNARVLIDAWAFTEDDVLVHALPLYHVHGLFVALHCALLAGARIRLLPRFDVGEVLGALSGASVFMGVPTYYTRLLGTEAFPGGDMSLRLWISGSAPLLPETFAAFEARVGVRILERYGMSEAGMITSNPLRGERRPGTVGLPLAGVEIRVRANDGHLAGVEEPGVLEIRGPNVFSGYWRNEEKTRESFTEDGYFVTGDVVTVGADGVVAIVGREKDLIISGGLNVYPREVEEEIDRLAGVRESAVVGVPHPDFGEGVIAIVDRSPDGPDEGQVVTALRGRLAPFKVPKRVLFVTELPRNAMGKVQKNVLRVRFQDVLR